jgi:hypothetical protein
MFFVKFDLGLRIFIFHYVFVIYAIFPTTFTLLDLAFKIIIGSKFNSDLSQIQ